MTKHSNSRFSAANSLKKIKLYLKLLSMNVITDYLVWTIEL